MQRGEKVLAQLERQKKYVTYRVKMFPISDDGKFFFDRTTPKYGVTFEELKNTEFYGEVVADFPIYYPEEFIDENSLFSDFVNSMTWAAGQWNHSLKTSRKAAWFITRKGAELYPELEYKKDYDFKIIEKIVHDPEGDLWDDIKPLKTEKEETTSK